MKVFASDGYFGTNWFEILGYDEKIDIVVFKSVPFGEIYFIRPNMQDPSGLYTFDYEIEKPEDRNAFDFDDIKKYLKNVSVYDFSSEIKRRNDERN